MFDLESHTFFGSAPEFVVVVAGIHTSEQSGVEVAHWVRTKLAARSVPPRLGAIVVPEMFPAQGEIARAREWEVGTERWSNDERQTWARRWAWWHLAPLVALAIGLAAGLGVAARRCAARTWRTTTAGTTALRSPSRP